MGTHNWKTFVAIDTCEWCDEINIGNNLSNYFQLDYRHPCYNCRAPNYEFAGLSDTLITLSQTQTNQFVETFHPFGTATRQRTDFCDIHAVGIVCPYADWIAHGSSTHHWAIIAQLRAKCALMGARVPTHTQSGVRSDSIPEPISRSRCNWVARTHPPSRARSHGCRTFGDKSRDDFNRILFVQSRREPESAAPYFESGAMEPLNQ